MTPSFVGQPIDPSVVMDRNRFPVDPWALTERSFSASDMGKTESLFAVTNGYLGLRGNSEQGREGQEHGTFINGLHETWQIEHAENAYGFAEVGQTMVNAPDAKTIRVYVDDEPLSMLTSEIVEYERKLDFKTGVLHTYIVWRTPSGKLVRIETTRMVSFTQRHLAVMSLEITVLNASAPVAISSQLVNRQDRDDSFSMSDSEESFDPRKSEAISDRVFIPQVNFSEHGRLFLGYELNKSKMTLGVGVEHRIDTADEYTVHSNSQGDMAKAAYRIRATAGTPTRLTKYAVYHTGKSTPARELIDRCIRTLDRAVALGRAELEREQREFLADVWSRSDVEIKGHDDLQQAIRWNIFQLIQASARADGGGIAAKGQTGSGYSGHYFWDTEIYVNPFLTFTNPSFARNALHFRYQMLPAARARAAKLNETGALFPWRTINGEEASAYYAAGTAQYHIDADIAFAVAKYVWITGDTEFFLSQGIDIIVETARMWASLGFWRVGANQFHIHSVTGPDEYTTVVNDNLFTNTMARFNLRFAGRKMREIADDFPEEFVQISNRLGVTEPEIAGWERAWQDMFIPYDDTLGVHPQDDHFLEREIWDLSHTPPENFPLLLHYHPLVIYRFQVLKQADVVLGLFLHGDEFSLEEKLADFDYYDPITTGDSTLSAVVQSIIAAEVGYNDLALEYFYSSLFVDLGDLHNNTSDGVHIASTGGVWNALVSGFGGMRDYSGKLSFDPRLPKDWEELSYHLTFAAAHCRVTVRHDSITVEVLEGSKATFKVRGIEYTAEWMNPTTVPLDGQGPIRYGRPTQRQLTNTQREDGTVITAELPIIEQDIIDQTAANSDD